MTMITFTGFLSRITFALWDANVYEEVFIQTQGQPGLAAEAQMCEHRWIKRVRTCKLDFFPPTPGENDSLCSQQARCLPSVNRTILSLTEAHPCGLKSRAD